MSGLLLLVAAVASVLPGSALVAARLRAEERIGVALATAPMLLAWAVLPVALLRGLDVWSALAGGALLLGAGALALRTAVRRAALAAEWADLWRRVRAAPRASAASLAVLLSCLALSAPLLSRVWIEQPDASLATGTANNLGDVVLHVGIAHAFVWGDNLPPDDPIWAGRRLAYPFLPDFLSAALIASGASTRLALAAPGLCAMGGLLLLLAALGWRATQRLEVALLPGPLLLLGGGSQYLMALAPLLRGAAPAWPPADALAAGRIVWQNPLLSLLVTQRTTLAGLALIAAALLLVWVASHEPTATGAWRELAWAGLLCGSLPLVFAHGYLALAAVLPLALLGRRELWKGALALGLAAALPALPQVLWLTGELGGGFVRWLPGWLAAEPPQRPGALQLMGFWWWNLGPLVPLALAAPLLAARIGLARPGFWGAGWAAFVLPSLWVFAPWPWDNTKLFAVWLLLALVPVSALLGAIARGGRWGSAVTAVLVTMLCGSGARDVGWALFVETPHREYAASEREAALRLRQQTPARAVVLEAPHWAQLARLAGRRSAIGYPGHLWSHGIDHREREREVEAFYRSLAPGAAARPGQWRAFLEGLGVDCVVVGPRERARYGSDPARLRRALPELFQTGGVSAFSVP